MTILRKVSVVRDGTLTGRTGAGADVSGLFLRAAAGVCELYYDALTRVGTQHWAGGLRLEISQRPGAGTEIAVEIMPARADEGPVARVMVPGGFAVLGRMARAMSVADVVHAVLVGLHQGRGLRWEGDGWDLGALDGARAEVMEHGMVYAWASPWKTAPGRRRKARGRYWLGPDGAAGVVLEVLEVQPTGDATALKSIVFEAYPSRAGFRGSAGTIRWVSMDRIEFSPWAEPAAASGDPVSVSMVDDLIAMSSAPPWQEAPQQDDVAGRPTVSVVQLHHPGEISEIDVSGIDGLDTVHPAYRDALLRDVHQLTTPLWQQWWAAAQVNLLSVTVDLVPDDSNGPAVQRTVRRPFSIRTTTYVMTAAIVRTATSTFAVADPAVLARQDLTDLVAAVAKKAKLPPSPEFLLDDMPSPGAEPGAGSGAVPVRPLMISRRPGPEQPVEPRRAVFKHVIVFPYAGKPGHPWADAPQEDAFARSARSICELYYDALATAGIRHRTGSLQLNLGNGSAGQRAGVITSEVVASLARSQEWARLSIPPEFADASALTRAMSVVDVIHETLLCLGRRHGWDLALVHSARRTVIDAGLVFAWTSAWKSSPGRRRRARVRFWLEPDGWGRAVLEIERTPDDVMILRSPAFTAYVGRAGFQRSAKTLRWRSADEVEFFPFVSPFGDDDEVVSVALAPELDSALVPVIAPAPSPIEALERTGMGQRPRVDALDLTEPPETPRIRVIGGGPMNGVNAAYEAGKHAALDRLQGSPQWLDWWRQADCGTLEIWYEFDPVKVGPSVRKLSNKVIARIIRSAASTQDAVDPAELGRRDIIDLMTAVAKRVRLADPPLHLLHATTSPRDDPRANP